MRTEVIARKRRFRAWFAVGVLFLGSTLLWSYWNRSGHSISQPRKEPATTTRSEHPPKEATRTSDQPALPEGTGGDGREALARDERVALRGRVVSSSGQPIENARVACVPMTPVDVEVYPSWPTPPWGIPMR